MNTNNIEFTFAKLTLNVGIAKTNYYERGKA